MAVNVLSALKPLCTHIKNHERATILSFQYTIYSVLRMLIKYVEVNA